MFNRREFLLVCLATGSNAKAMPLTALRAETNAPLAADAAAEIGRRYLELYPAENQRAMLLRTLRRDQAVISGPEIVSRLSVDTENLAAACRDDYACGRTVYLDGWLFAQTELRLCALAALG